MSGPEDKPPRSADSPTLPYASGAPASAGDTSPGILAAVAERYEVLEELGRGGMGVVYRARDRETGDVLALKVLRDELARDEGVLERFRNELRLARKITHKNVCRMYELLRFGNHVVISMEWVAGESLREVLRRFGALSRLTTLRMAEQICAALAEAHGQGVVHRDLKPENIVVDRDGNVKVMDFGIARSLRGGGETSGTTVMGTPAYMAPEQIDGKATDARTDIYALGLMLHEMLSGRSVFDGETPVTMAMQHLKAAPPRLREVEPSVPEAVEKAVLRCLEKSPAKRYQSVSELVEALREAPAAPVAQPAEAPAPWRLVRWTRADWWLGSAALCGAIVFLLLFDSVLPYAALAVPFGRGEAVERAKKIAHEYVPGSEDLEYRTTYGFGAEERETAWAVDGSRPGGKDGFSIEFDHRGRVCFLWAPRAAPATSQGSPPAEDFAATEPFARAAAERLFEIKLAEPARRHAYDPTSRSWVYRDDRPKLEPRGWWTRKMAEVAPFVWEVREEGMPPRLITVWAAHDRVWLAASRYQLAGRTGKVTVEYTLPSAVGSLMLLILAGVVAILFFRKKLYQRTEWPVVALAVLTAAGITVFAQSTGDEIAGWELVVTSIVAVPILYLLMAVPYHYLAKSLPESRSTLRALVTRPLAEAGAGLALVRGLLLGCAFAGAQAALLWLVTRSDLVLHAMFWLTIAVSTLFHFGRAYPNPAWGVAVTVPWAVLWAMLVALPVALIKRASALRWAPLLGTAAVWLVAAAALPGTALYPAWAMYAVSALQGALFAWVLVRYDLLTLMALFLTVETLFVVYPLYRLNAGQDNWVFGAGFAPLAAVALAAAFLMAWPTLRQSWQRMKLVVE